jgi:hypothetical protein
MNVNLDIIGKYREILMNVEVTKCNSANLYHHAYYNETGAYCGSTAGSKSIIALFKALLNQINSGILPKCPIQVTKEPFVQQIL